MVVIALATVTFPFLLQVEAEHRPTTLLARLQLFHQVALAATLLTITLVQAILEKPAQDAPTTPPAICGSELLFLPPATWFLIPKQAPSPMAAWPFILALVALSSL